MVDQSHPMLGTQSQPAPDPNTGAGDQHQQPAANPAEDTGDPKAAQFQQLVGHAYGHDNVPSDPAGYDNLPFDSFEGDAEALNATRQLFHHFQIPKLMAKGILEEVRVADRYSSEETEHALRQVWGSRYDEQMANARSFLDGMAPTQREAMEQLIDETGLGDSPRFIQQLANLQSHRGRK